MALVVLIQNWICWSEIASTSPALPALNMFNKSKFDGDISKWDVSGVLDMKCMFRNSKFNGDISQWNVSSVKEMSFMFAISKFNGDISQWKVSSATNMIDMVFDCPLENNPPTWYKNE